MSKVKRVVLGFSGGVDSAAVAVLLKRQGYQVIPVVLDLGGADTQFLLDRASKMAARLGLKLLVESAAEVFAKEVIDDLLFDYAHAQTPNPCIRCNARVKFARLAVVADRLKIEKLATGHYFRKLANASGKSEINYHKALDQSKDQSYFLLSVPKILLHRTLFPLGEISKAEALSLAAEAGYELDNYRESQELCFLNGEKYQEFLVSRGVTGGRGEIVDSQGRLLGEHQGLQNYTVGQRRGMGIAHPEPLYVIKLDYQHNRLLVGEREETYGSRLQVYKINWLIEPPSQPFKIECQIRYRHQPAPALLIPLTDEQIKIEFESPQYAITPGQGAAFYSGDRLLGGGIIL
ncbi:MAG: tRNA 2-thiouridine(34) synthase MnmA [Deltaproteobacteria bacterium]|nr:tRNA 2-thiouridine(34) synthase MnmA [Deltaproteobacteria bacterium]